MKLSLIAGAVLLTSMSFSSLATQCDFTPNKDAFAFSFTAYGAKDKSYVVSKNTFNSYELASSTGKLVGASINIDATSLDTSKDLNNGIGGQWPAALATMRDNNVINGLFNNFVNPGKISAKIAAISKDKIDLAVTMNGQTKTVAMAYTVTDGKLNAEGILEILDFSASEAFKKFAALCTTSWHKGKSWTDVKIEFTVPVSGDSCK
ncbi:MAG: hypothetical protein GY787_02295 [Alteromonadales bacterium]|nr:hypothetical protein [Alteromonadales bacterium]MCP4991269.1 hypothetical protein [Colwellia sp.]